MIEFTTKFEAVDRPVSTKEIPDSGWMTEKELGYISRITEKINDIMFNHLLRKDILLADFKIEFGRTQDGKTLLADEVGTPDGCRFWDRNAWYNDHKFGIKGIRKLLGVKKRPCNGSKS